MKVLPILIAVGISTTLAAQLGNPTRIRTASSIEATAKSSVGDIDGDGLNDVLFSEFDRVNGGMFYLRGTSNFPYFESVPIRISEDFGQSLLGDFNSDGHLDALQCAEETSAGGDGYIRIYWNDGSGQFGSPQDLIHPGNSGGRIPLSGDVDGDGDLDFVYTVLNAPNTVFPSGTVWMKNLGNGTFEFDIIGTSRAYDIALDDITGDAKTDIMITELLDDRIAVYENVDNQGFQFLIKRGLTEYPSEIHSGDFNGDGLLDFIVSAADVTRFIAYYENTGMGNFDFDLDLINNSNMRPSTNVEVLDFDGDGDLDILWSSLNSLQVGWFSNDGSGNFSDAGILINGESTYVIDQAGDINGDGFADLIHLSRNEGSSGIALNNGSGGLEVIDFNEVRRLDISYIRAVENDGDQSRELLVLNETKDFVQVFDDLEADRASLEHVFTSDFTSPTQGDLFDADQSGKTDAIVLYEEALVIFLRDHSGDYSTLELGGSADVDHFELFDFNEDGVEDVIASSTQNQRVYGWFSNGSGFGLRQTISTELSNLSKFAIVEESSGTLLQGVIFSDQSGDVVNLPYQGAELFGEEIEVLPSTLDHVMFGVADVNADGLTDLILANDFGIFKSENDGSGNLQPEVAIDFESEINEFFIEDLTNDGIPDLVAYRTGQNDAVRFYENLGTGNFFLENAYSNNNVVSASVADMDNDGDADLVAAVSNRNRIYLVKSKFPAPSNISIEQSVAESLTSELSIYPNPVQHSFRLNDVGSVGDQMVHLSLFDTSGKLVFQDQNISKYDEFDISFLPTGSYFALLTEEKSRAQHRFSVFKTE